MCFKLIFSIGLQTKNTGSLIDWNCAFQVEVFEDLKYKYRVLSDKLKDEN